MLKSGLFIAGAGALCHVIRQRAFAAAKVPVVRALSSSAGSAAAARKPKTAFRLGMCQIGPVGSEKPKNLVLARNAVEQAGREGAELVVLPECFNSPYATDQFPVYAEPIPPVGTTADGAAAQASASPSTGMLCGLAREHGIYLVGGSIPERDAGTGAVYNCCVVADPSGTIVLKHRKMHLFDIDVPGGITFKESDTLTAGDAVSTFDFAPCGCTVGVAICYDIRFPELAMLMRAQGAQVLLYPGAFNMTTGPPHWELLQRARALDNQCYVAAVSPARNPASSYQAWGHTTLISPWGDVVATTEHAPAVVVADVDLTKVAEIRQNIPVSLQKRHDVYSLDQK